MASSENLSIDIQDKEIISLDIVEKEIINIQLYAIDTLTGLRKNISEFDDVNIENPVNGQILVRQDGKWVNTTISDLVSSETIHNETPTPSTPVSEGDPYQTAYAFVSNTLEVFLNGMRLEKEDFTILSTKTFSIGIDTISSDKVSVNYMKAE